MVNLKNYLIICKSVLLQWYPQWPIFIHQFNLCYGEIRMIVNNTLLSNSIVFISYFLHGFSICALVDYILVKPRFPFISRIVFLLIYSTMSVFFLGYWSTMPSVLFLCYFSLYTIAFLILYTYLNFLSVLMCSLAITLHIISIQTITLSIFSLILGLPYQQVINSGYLPYIISLFMVLLSMCTLVVRRVIPAKYYKLICDNKSQLGFLNILLGLFVLYMCLNVNYYASTVISTFFIINEIAVSIVMMCGMYLGLFFLIRVNALQEYREKSKTLEETLDRDKLYRELMLSDTVITYEVNCTKDILYKISDGGKDRAIDNLHTYSEILNDIINRNIFPEDKTSAESHLLPQYLIHEFNKGTDETTLEYRRLQKNGNYGWVRTTVNTAKDSKTNDITAVIMVKDIDVEKQAHINLQYRADRDALTGAFNKEVVQKRIASYLRDDRQGTLLILDVDDFKNVNDQMGHMYGDAVLSRLVQIVKKTFRGEDIVGRVGGDEFIIFMRNNVSEFDVAQKAAALCKNIEDTDKWDSQHVCHVSCSVGIAIAPGHGTYFEDLYKKADIALYRSKHKGKNTYSIFEGDDTPHILQQRTAIDSDQ